MLYEGVAGYVTGTKTDPPGSIPGTLGPLVLQPLKTNVVEKSETSVV